jgi:hypothetical protein
VRRVFEENVEDRWKPLTTELSSAALTEEQRALCAEIVTAGLTVAANLLQVLGNEIEVAVVREYVASIPQEKAGIAEWKATARATGTPKPPLPLSKCLALYEEQILEMRALAGIADLVEAERSSPKPVWAWNSNAPVQQAEPKPIEQPNHVVLLVHGIRTEAEWQERVAKIIRRTGVVEVIPLKYGYFDVFRFLSPWATRMPPIQRLHRELRSVQRKFPNAQVSVIAHSFGTYAICTLLEEFRDLTLDRLILCGSVVREEFRWDRISEQVRHRVVNECGAKDIWPRLASACSWGYGATGAVGFGSSEVRDRYHPGKHSDFFADSFVGLYWVPFILYGEIPDSPYEQNRGRSPWLHEMLAFMPIKWLLAAGLLALAWGGLHALAINGLI